MISSTPNFMAVHPDYAAVRYKWDEIFDALKGQHHIKNLCLTTYKYLPDLNCEPNPTENYARYKSYVRRAVWYNATARTLDGMVGQVFSKPPVAEFPPEVQYLNDDPSGSGITLEQQAKGVLRTILSYGRGGLWVNLPATGGMVTKAQKANNLIRPTIRLYNAMDILNWRTQVIGSNILCTMVMLRERVPIADDGYSVVYGYQYRELRLDSNQEYCARLWTTQGKNMFPSSWVYPQGSNGARFNQIPFTFVGIHDNDADVDDPPIYDLVTLNFAHFRNSADYEDSVHMVGQPTPWISGLDQNWYNDVLKKKIYLGSRACIPLPAGGAAGLLQADGNMLAKESMDQKEQQMVALGARLVQKAIVTKTATESSNDKVTEVSTLAAAARNTSAAYQTAFKYCSMYSGDNQPIKFELSTDFDMTRMTSQEILALMAVWQGKGITTGEFRENLRKAGYATESVDKAIADGVLAKPGTDAPVDSNQLQTQNKQKSPDNRVSTT